MQREIHSWSLLQILHLVSKSHALAFPVVVVFGYLVSNEFMLGKSLFLNVVCFSGLVIANRVHRDATKYKSSIMVIL